ncbi:MAG: trypsin-like peptidase domain-containing protein [Myxococcota bacterium]
MRCLVLILFITACAGPAPAAPLSLTELSTGFQKLSAQVGTSVVRIESVGYGPDNENGQLLSRQQSTGSGVVVSPEGHVITNAHVVQGAQKITVHLPRSPGLSTTFQSIVKPSGRMVEAELLGIDLETDLALLKIASPPGAHLNFGNSDELAPGQIVLAFGSPLGLEGSVSMGVVSAVARQLRPDDRVVYVQTDAPINPGNSGGPLVDTQGRLVGINTFILSQSGGSEGLGFAVPSNIVRTVYEHLKSFGYVRRGTIGAATQTLSPALAGGLGLNRSWGVIVSDVLPRSPAASGGLEVGDTIVALNGKRMENSRQFEVNVYQSKIGATIAVEVVREGQTRRLEIPVVERPNVMERLTLQLDPRKDLIPELGVLGLSLEGDMARLLPNVRVPGGVLITAASGPHPLQPGDIIHRCNSREVSDFEALRQALSDREMGDPIVLQIERSGQLSFVAFRLDG